MGITSTKEEAGLVSGGKGWFPLVSWEEGLVSAGFRVGRTGFGWFRVGRTGFGWFRLISLFSNYPFLARRLSFSFSSLAFKSSAYFSLLSESYTRLCML